MTDEGGLKLTATNDRKREDSMQWGGMLQMLGLIGLFGTGVATYRHRGDRRKLFRDIREENQKRLAWKSANSSFGPACQLEEEEMVKVEVVGMRDLFESWMEKLKRRYERLAGTKGIQIYINAKEVRIREGRWWERHFSPWKFYQLDDLYCANDTSFGDLSVDFRQMPGSGTEFPLSQHYAVLGLDSYPSEPYTEAEIKSAFEAKVKEFHFDQNPYNKETSEAKFQEVLTAHEAIVSEMKNMNL